MNITRPTLMSLNDWADQVAFDLDRYGPVERLQGDDWRGWAERLAGNPRLPHNMPSPAFSTDWREWAERLCEVLG